MASAPGGQTPAGGVALLPGELLRQIPYFAGLDDDALADIARSLLERRYRRGDIVFLEGERCQGLFIVGSGRVHIFKVSLEGREQVLMVAGQGETFNEVPVFDGGPNPASAQTMEASLLYLLPRDDLLRAVERYPVVARAIMSVFASHLRHLAALVEDLSFRNVTSRVARILLRQLEQEPTPAAPRLTQQQMAAMAGTAREVVSRALKALEQRGAVRIDRGRIIVTDREALMDTL